MDSKTLQQSLDSLAELESQMGVAERDCEIYRLKKTSQIYKSRSTVLAEIPKFWYIVLAENDEFADYIGLEDLKYLESIVNINVEYKIAEQETDLDHFKDFSITFSFDNDQVVTKEFHVIITDGEEKIISKPVDIIWPEELKETNPRLIKDRAKKNKTELSKDDKKNYRLGIKSFYSWFSWTGEKPGKEFRNGEELTRLIIDDLFLNAIKYYVLALQNDDQDEESEDENDSSEGEELDLSEEERDVKKQKTE